MGGSASVPNVLGALSGGQQNLALIDADFDAITQYVNLREVSAGTLAARPAAGVAGRWYFATDVNGGTLYVDTGAAWSTASPGLTQAPNVQTLVGLTLSNDPVTPLTVLDVAAGACNSNDAAIASRVLMVSSGLTGTTGGTWVVGTGQPKLDTGAVQASSTYHVFVIQRVDTGVVDVLFSLSPTGPTLPASYTKLRRIGSFLTDASSQILAFIQDGDLFQWITPLNDIGVVNPGTAAVTRTLTVPTGVHVVWLGAAEIANPGALAGAYFSDLATADISPATVYQLLAEPTTSQIASCQLQVRTNTAAQIRSRLSFSDGTTNLVMHTTGWFDRRGQDA